MIVAIDGPAASGKGTLAKRIADHLGLPYLDTGLLYRAVARDVRRRGEALDDAAAPRKRRVAWTPRAWMIPICGATGSGRPPPWSARIPEVRAALLELQRILPAQPGGAVLDGRDIGTVVCPDADVKIFVTASPEVRAERRYLGDEGPRGEPISYEAVLADIRLRDERDAGREVSPMRPAIDAFLLDTSNLDIEAAFNTAVGVISRKVGQRGRT